ARERALQAACLALARRRLLVSAHDCAEGGLLACLAECAVAGPALVGATLELADELRPDLLLFAEAPSRIVISIREADQAAAAAAQAAGARFAVLGKTGGRRLTLRNLLDVPVSDLAAVWHSGFRRLVE